MAEWIDVAQMRIFSTGSQYGSHSAISLFSCSERGRPVFAIGNQCTHQGAGLDGGS